MSRFRPNDTLADRHGAPFKIDVRPPKGRELCSPGTRAKRKGEKGVPRSAARGVEQAASLAFGERLRRRTLRLWKVALRHVSYVSEAKVLFDGPIEYRVKKAMHVADAFRAEALCCGPRVYVKRVRRLQTPERKSADCGQNATLGELLITFERFGCQSFRSASLGVSFQKLLYGDGLRRKVDTAVARF